MDLKHDYYTVKLYKNAKPLGIFRFELFFIDVNPTFVEAFDATQGGESKFIKRLTTQSLSSPYFYGYQESRIQEERDIAFRFTKG